MNLENIGLTINQLMRYGYPGMIISVVAYIVFPNETEKLVSILKPTISIIVSLGVGVLFYNLYRPFIGETVIWPIYDFIHKHYEPHWGFIGGNRKSINCKRHYLEFFGVSDANSLDAYRLIRNKRPWDFAEGRFEIQHSEIHLLYITFIVLYLSSPLLIYSMPNNEAVICWISIIIWVMVFLAIPISKVFCISRDRRKACIVNTVIVLIIILGLLYLLWWFTKDMPANEGGVLKIVLFLLISILSLLFGFKADIDLCRRECAHLKLIPEHYIVNLLKNAGYIS